MDILQGLNEAQIAAVSVEARQVLVVAGAGSGKTGVLVRRLAWLIENQGVSPYQIMAVTFTNKAAREMRQRVEDLTGIDTRRMWIGTFHALCSRLLRIEAESLGIPRDFVIYDDGDSRSLIKQCLVDLGLQNKENEYHPAAVGGVISMAKNKLMSPSDYAAADADAWSQNVSRIYSRYQQLLHEARAFDFDDLLTQAVRLLERHPEVLARYRERFGHILVDEYQDTNYCQYRLIRLLAGESGHIFAVGDPDQSIYKWRGADIANILDFSRDYPDCRELQLTQNYRSSQNILDAANAVIANNLARRPKDLFTEAGCGEKLVYYRATDDREEAYYVIRTIAELLREGYSLHDCAVLYRTHGQSRLFEDECIRFNINYRVFGGLKFYERKEVKDSFAYLRLIFNPFDSEAMRRIYNEPRRGIGKATWEKLLDLAAQRGKSPAELLESITTEEEFSAAVRGKLQQFQSLLLKLRQFAADNDSVAQIISEVWRSSGYAEMIAADPQAAERGEIIEQFYDTAADFDRYFEQNAEQIPEEERESRLGAFLSQTALATDMDEAEANGDFLTLMTLHAAKGLEFPVIFLVGMEEGLFPHKRVIFSGDAAEMEEERRLCYVGMTRAKARLYLTAASRRQLWGRYEAGSASRFIGEIPDTLLNKSGAAEKPAAAAGGSTSRLPRTSIFIAPKAAEPPRKQIELIQVGDRLRHAKFGDGIVMAVTGSGEDMILEAAFPEAGLKKLLWKYAPVKKIQ
jgi:DNA helicase II / ATP-dependent DNA helicase PcrA